MSSQTLDDGDHYALQVCEHVDVGEPENFQAFADEELCSDGIFINICHVLTAVDFDYK